MDARTKVCLHTDIRFHHSCSGLLVPGQLKPGTFLQVIILLEHSALETLSCGPRMERTFFSVTETVSQYPSFISSSLVQTFNSLTLFYSQMHTLQTFLLCQRMINLTQSSKQQQRTQHPRGQAARNSSLPHKFTHLL